MDRVPDEVTTQTRRLLARDGELAAEIAKLAVADEKPAWLPRAERALKSIIVARGGEPPTGFSLVTETLVERVGRPVLAIRQGEPELAFVDAESEVWRSRLTDAALRLRPAVAATGRIEAANLPGGAPYVGTGWLIEPDVIVTNRHVALEFADRSRDGFVFRRGFDRRSPITVGIDFLEELDDPRADEFQIEAVIDISFEPGPDVAFLKVIRTGGRRLAAPLRLAAEAAEDAMVAVIGYPAKDHRVPDQALMRDIFGDVYDKKRLAPGYLTGREAGSLRHDCSTLGGNSGSPLIDMQSGNVIGLHYAGVFREANYAVPARTVADLLRRARDGRPGASPRQPLAKPDPLTARPEVTDPRISAGSPTSASGEVTFTIPLSVSIRLGEPVAAGAAVAALATTRPTLSATMSLDEAVVEARRTLAARTDVVSITAGYRFRDGWITDERCVVLGVRAKLSPEALHPHGVTPLPREIGGVPVDVTTAPLLLEPGPGLTAAAEGRRAWVSNYQPRPDLPLDPVDDEMSVIVHAGPDAGWPQLSAFLEGTRERLTVGIYEFTAPHVVDAVLKAVGRGSRELSLVVQAGQHIGGPGTKRDDIPDAETLERLTDALEDRLAFAWASVKGPDRLFDSSYHIKTAVRDGEAVWLSSGSWQSSNQPPYDPIGEDDLTPPLLQQYNREWHVVLEHKGLAERFEAHLLRDREEAAAQSETALLAEPEPELWVPADAFQPVQAELEAPVRYFPPLEVRRRVRVQPLFTPDNYAGRVLDLISSARERLYFQNQSLSVFPEGENAEPYERLLQALREKQRSGLDVRIIFRRFGELRETVTRLKDFGFDTETMRVQTNCHTKGIVVDGARVLVGSHNWTNAGTVFNRDASLIFDDPEIAGWYETLFLYDWNRIGRPRIDESLPAAERVRMEEGRPHPGKVRVRWSDWFDG